MPAHEVERGDTPSVVILGSGPNRIGQGIEFDYCCVHAAQTVRESGRDAVMINCNPETVSTDYDTSDRLYFEPLTLEDVLGVCEVEQPEGVIVQFGGQTPLKLAAGLREAGIPILGTTTDAIDLAEDRARFGPLLDQLGYKAPPYASASTPEEALERAPEVGFPLLVRPSYVLGGRAMEIVYSVEGLQNYLERVGVIGGSRARTRRESPTIYLDRFLEDSVEVDVDALCDGEDVWIAGIMQHVEEAGIHSGDSACVLPPHSLGEEMLDEIRAQATGIAKALGVVGLLNVQFAVHATEGLHVIEANPRASRTVPFVSKAIGLPVAKLACRIMLGEKLADLDLPDEVATGHVCVKEAVLPFDRFAGTDVLLGPEMRSTGEVMGIARDFPTAFAKAQAAAGARLPSERHGVHHRRRPRQVGGHRDRDPAPRPGLQADRDARHRQGAGADGDPGARRSTSSSEGSPHVVEAIEQRRGRPRDQHPGRHRRPHGRLRDPCGGGRAPDPLHHDDVGRDRGGPGDRGRRARRAGGGLAAGALRRIRAGLLTGSVAGRRRDRLESRGAHGDAVGLHTLYWMLRCFLHADGVRTPHRSRVVVMAVATQFDPSIGPIKLPANLTDCRNHARQCSSSG